MKVLVAEDDAVAGKYLTMALQRLGHEAILCINGQQALEVFSVHQPYIIISDWMMPQMDGLELCQRVRAMRLDHYTYFILQTAKNSKEDYRIGMDAGVDDFLTKPVNHGDLGIRLRVAERMIQQRIESERLIRQLARFPADNPNPILQVDREFKIIYANSSCLGLLDALNAKIGDMAPKNLRDQAEVLFSTGQRQEIEIPCAERVFSFSATSVSPEGVACLYGHDITERKHAERELVVLKNQAEENALHDQLTGLPNRRLFNERLHQETVRALRQGTRLALVMVDIDNFKQINDGYGHRVGDQVIVTISQCLQDSLRATDTVCRWGGDELVLLLSDLKERESVAAICGKLMQSVQDQTRQADIAVPVSLSMGSALFPDDTDDSTLLMQQADYALYVAKADGRDCWREFKEFPGGHDSKGQADLFMRLGVAVADGQIAAFFQPIISTQTQQVVGAEALARWHDEQHGWVSPDLFIPLAEAKGLIFKLGHLVLVQALDRLEEWRRRGLIYTVAINLSKRQLLDPDFLPDLLQLISERALRPEWVILEVTERQAVLDQAAGRERLKELADAGFRLSIDDFGSGYSSFDLVGEASFSELKVHLGLVQRSHTDRGRRIVQAIVEMARTLKLNVVAEGIEDHQTQAVLTALGVEKLQGYLFSKPLDAVAFLHFAESFQAGMPKAA